MANISIEQFEKEALAFLESNAERRPVEKAFVWGEGSDNFYREKDRDQEAINAEEGKGWRQKKSIPCRCWTLSWCGCGPRQRTNGKGRQQKVAISLDFLLKLQEAIHERLCSWRAPRNVNVNGHNAIATSNDGI